MEVLIMAIDCDSAELPWFNPDNYFDLDFDM